MNYWMNGDNISVRNNRASAYSALCRKKEQRRANIYFALYLLTILVASIGIIALDSHAEGRVAHKEYSLMTICTDITGDTVTVEDINGNEWQFEGRKDYNEGDIITLIMDNKSTQLIYDDEIKSSHYDGWLGLWNERFEGVEWK